MMTLGTKPPKLGQKEPKNGPWSMGRDCYKLLMTITSKKKIGLYSLSHSEILGLTVTKAVKIPGCVSNTA